MTFDELTLDLYRRLGYASSPDSAVVTRLKAFVNEAQRDVYSEPGLERLLLGTTPVLSVVNQPQYALPPSVSRIERLVEITNRRFLLPMSVETYRQLQPDPTTPTGTPTHYVDLGVSAISVQPSDASQLFLDSTAAGDTATAYVEGYRTGGYFSSLSKVMTGTTGLALSSAITDFIEVTKFYLSAAAVGTVTLLEDAEGGTVLATIPIGQTFSRYRRIALWPTPSVAITYQIDYERELPSMVNANDEPLLPVRFHPLLIEGALKREMTKKDDARVTLATREYERRLGQLKYWVATQMDGRLTMGRQTTERPSVLGGYFESGT